MKIPDLVTGAEAARRLGVSRQRVQQFACDPRGTFPRPVARIGYAHVYLWRDVEAWSKARSRKLARAGR